MVKLDLSVLAQMVGGWTGHCKSRHTLGGSFLLPFGSAYSLLSGLSLSFCPNLNLLPPLTALKKNPMSLNLPVCLWLPWKWRLPPSGWADGALALGFSPDKRRAVSLFSLLGDFFLQSQSLKCPRFEMYVAGCEGRRRRRRSWDCGIADLLHSYVRRCGPLLQLHQPPRRNRRRRSPKFGRRSKHTRKRGGGGPQDFSWVETHV